MFMKVIVEERQLKSVALKYLEDLLENFNIEEKSWKDFTMFYKNVDSTDYKIEGEWNPKKKVYFVVIGKDLWFEIQSLFGLSYRDVQELFFEFFNKHGINKVRYITTNSKEKNFT